MGGISKIVFKYIKAVKRFSDKAELVGIGQNISGRIRKEFPKMVTIPVAGSIMSLVIGEKCSS